MIRDLRSVLVYTGILSTLGVALGVILALHDLELRSEARSLTNVAVQDTQYQRESCLVRQNRFGFSESCVTENAP